MSGKVIQEFLDEIETIRNHYSESRHKMAYSCLCRLCRELCQDNPQFLDLVSAADSIHSRYIDFENDIIYGKLKSGGQESIIKMDIGYSYGLLIDKVTGIIENEKVPYYKTKSRTMKEYCNNLKKVRIEIEDDLTECEVADKIEILENILEYLCELINIFSILIVKFQIVKKYE